MGLQDRVGVPGPMSLLRRFRGLLGVGGYLLVLGLLSEGLAVVTRRWVSFPVSLAVETQLMLSILCVVPCLLGALWFHRSLNLVQVHLLGSGQGMITNGPFAYVRHPLYATLLITLPPLAIVWFSDLLFFLPWGLLLIISHPVVRLEERGLVRVFGEDYERYRQRVPALLPYKRRWRKPAPPG